MTYNFQILTLKPELIEAYKGSSQMLLKAQEQNLIEIESIPLRDYGIGKRKNVDDKPYKGGESPILLPEVCEAALLARKKPEAFVIHLTPRGETFDHKIAKSLLCHKNLLFLCGRYGGFDERFIQTYAQREISLGDFVLTGGELAACAVIDSMVRFIPGVLGRRESALQDSFEDEELLEAPQYTKPLIFKGLGVPEVLRGGHHKAIERFERLERIKITAQKRPDIIKRIWSKLSLEEQALVRSYAPAALP
jgi:tRNA (guanine37-N1)-methyltransferase